MLPLDYSESNEPPHLVMDCLVIGLGGKQLVLSETRKRDLNDTFQV